MRITLVRCSKNSVTSETVEEIRILKIRINHYFSFDKNLKFEAIQTDMFLRKYLFALFHILCMNIFIESARNIPEILSSIAILDRWNRSIVQLITITTSEYANCVRM